MLCKTVKLSWLTLQLKYLNQKYNLIMYRSYIKTQMATGKHTKLMLVGIHSDLTPAFSKYFATID